jgi:hypothetical protein
MAQRDRRRMKPSPLYLVSADTAQLDNTLRIYPTGTGVGTATPDPTLRTAASDS